MSLPGIGRLPSGPARPGTGQQHLQEPVDGFDVPGIAKASGKGCLPDQLRNRTPGLELSGHVRERVIDWPAL